MATEPTKAQRKLASVCAANLKSDPKDALRMLQECVTEDWDLDMGIKDSTLMCEASRHGRLEICKFLVENNATIDKRDGDGCTPLYIAASHGHSDVTEYLLDQGANPDIPNRTNYTAVLTAMQNNKFECVNLLIDHGANVNVKRPNTFGVDLDLLTYVLFAKGDMGLTMKIVEAGALPSDIQAPLGYILLEDKDMTVRFIKKIIYSGFVIKSADNWLRVMRARIAHGMDDLRPAQIEMADFIDEVLHNPLTLQQICVINVRTCVIKGGNPDKKHFKDRLYSLPDLPELVLKCLTLEYI